MPPAPEPPDRDPVEGGPTDDEIDRRFAELTADLELDATLAEVPDAEGDALSEPADAVGHGPRDYALAEEPDEVFEPPEPEPLDSADPLQLLGWAGAVGGPIALILVLVLWPTAPSLVWLSAIGVTLVGWGVVIWRLPRSRKESDDDGAVL
jgi:hypothetical protein